MSDSHFDPETYLDDIHEAIPRYDDFQQEVARATEGIDARRILELGTGTGETALLVLERHPEAVLVGIDGTASMLEAAKRALPAERVEDLCVQDLADPLPKGPFDLVFSALAIHHLEADGKRRLFRRIAGALTAGGRFVLGDAVVPEDPAEAEIPLTEGYDFLDRADDQVVWLEEVGFRARILWAHRDLAVIAADRTPI